MEINSTNQGLVSLAADCLAYYVSDKDYSVLYFIDLCRLAIGQIDLVSSYTIL